MGDREFLNALLDGTAALETRGERVLKAEVEKRGREIGRLREGWLSKAELISRIERAEFRLGQAVKSLRESEHRVTILFERGDLDSDIRDRKITKAWIRRMRAALAAVQSEEQLSPEAAKVLREKAWEMYDSAAAQPEEESRG